MEAPSQRPYLAFAAVISSHTTCDQKFFRPTAYSRHVPRSTNTTDKAMDSKSSPSCTDYDGSFRDLGGYM
jgi:hypothetical protein